MEYQAILSGGEFTYEPAEYLGMRYFQIDNAPMPVTPDKASFIERYSAMDEGASYFDSPNATLNAVWDLMKHSLFTCVQEAFVDTPTREKGGFLGDAAIQSKVAMPVLHERPLTRRTLGEYLQSMDQFVPQEHRAAVSDHVKRKGMSVGMVTVLWLVRALGEANEGPALLELLTHPDQPGWARCLALGATATWESWDADTTNQSMSHAWGAAGLEAYVRYILGIRPLTPQYGDVLIQPLDFGGRLDSAEGKITTDRGEIAVRWERAPDAFTMRVTLPANVTARVALPCGAAGNSVVHLNGKVIASTLQDGFVVITGIGSGEHRIECREN